MRAAEQGGKWQKHQWQKIKYMSARPPSRGMVGVRIRTATERGCVRRTSHSTRKVRITFGLSETLRLVFDTAALRKRIFEPRRYPARTPGATTLTRNPAVASAEQLHQQRDTPKLPERPCPPKRPANFQQRIRSSKNFSIRLQQPHLREKRGIIQTQPFPHPQCLQGREFKAPACQCVTKLPSHARAKAAVSVITHPAVHFHIICNFSIHRN